MGLDYVLLILAKNSGENIHEAHTWSYRISIGKWFTRFWAYKIKYISGDAIFFSVDLSRYVPMSYISPWWQPLSTVSPKWTLWHAGSCSLLSKFTPKKTKISTLHTINIMAVVDTLMQGIKASVARVCQVYSCFCNKRINNRYAVSCGARDFIVEYCWECHHLRNQAKPINVSTVIRTRITGISHRICIFAIDIALHHNSRI